MDPFGLLKTSHLMTRQGCELDDPGNSLRSFFLSLEVDSCFLPGGRHHHVPGMADHLRLQASGREALGHPGLVRHPR